MGTRCARRSQRSGAASDSGNCGGAQGGGPPAPRVSVRERRSAVGRARKDLLASRSSFVRSTTERRRIAEGVADDSRPSASGQPATASVSDCDRQTVGTLKQESTRQGRSIFETSSVMAIAAVRALPNRARWLSASTRVGASRAGKLLAADVLDGYSQTLNELREVGYLTYAKRQLSPYLRACVDQFSQQRPTLTQRLLARTRKN